jgi:sugar phosphate isomerase/epimerase
MTAVDFSSAVTAVAKIGYQTVELAGYGNLLSANEAAAVLRQAGLRVVAGHVPLDYLCQYIDHCLNEALSLKAPRLIVPAVPESLRESSDGYRRAADLLNRLGERCHASGVRLGYHHHAFEWEPLPNGERGIDLLYRLTHAEYVDAELDIYWLVVAGECPVEVIRRLGRRVAVVHLKDMLPGDQPRFAPVGHGIIDFPAVLAALREYAPHAELIVEQDETYGDAPLACITCSYRYLAHLLA